jgi:hypothetical protein
MNTQTQRLKKLEFLIKESWNIAHQELHGTQEYHQAWQTFINYVHEYRLAHEFCNPSLHISSSGSRRVNPTKHPLDTSKIQYITQKLKGGEHHDRNYTRPSS